MKKIFFKWIILTSVCFSSPYQTNLISITGDRVSLRLKPSLEGSLLNRAMLGEEFVSIGSSNGWVSIKAPDYTPAWVSSEYISNNIVIANKLNVRIGPNINYGVLSVLSKNEKIEEIEKFNNWIKIVPPSNSIAWISSDYVDYLIISDPTNMIKDTELYNEDYDEGIDLNLDLNFSRAQGIKKDYLGMLREVYPGMYKLVSDSGDTICLVRGRDYQLQPLINSMLKLSGKEYFILDSIFPVLQPEEITNISILDE